MFNKIKYYLLIVHHWLLPAEKNMGLQPYFWLLYLFIYFFSYAFMDASQQVLIINSMTVSIFITSYFRAHHAKRREFILHIALITSIAIATTQINYGASVFFVYAAAFAGQLTPARFSLAIIATITGIIISLSWLLLLPMQFYLPAIFFTLMIGGINLHFAEINRKKNQLKQSEQEIKQLIIDAERERIARDLHDVMGHTLSLIALKSELASKLIDKDSNKAKQELLELNRITRQTLQEVRDTVSGYRESSIIGVLSRAKVALENANITLHYQLPDMTLPDRINQPMSYVIKEAITNIIRHSSADQCSLSFDQHEDALTVIIKDNGDSNQQPLTEGNGLKGIRERIEAIGGEFSYLSQSGFTLSITVPVSAS